MVRTLANLEADLGTRLLRRTTRRLSLTEEGRGYLARCRAILADVEEAVASHAEILGRNLPPHDRARVVHLETRFLLISRRDARLDRLVFRRGGGDPHFVKQGGYVRRQAYFAHGVGVVRHFAHQRAQGYAKRFGLVHVDFQTLRRTPKVSALWLREVIEDGGV